ncbi:MAG: helix-turn-helix domain-containing protein [Bryobacterales bacterium]|nr:helix-turn-helix domain-containing protein [Bryobacterales bacterium]MDE0436663.1 helix-turn-helix domain-containing protein [Bryobacterales bacterium]
MTTRTEAGMPLGIPSERDAALADRAGRALDALIDGTEPVSARFGDQTVDLPAPALRLLREILDWMAHGKGVALTPLHAELTTPEAAELLQVSRTHLVQLLDEGRIPCRIVGSHRRVRTEDILAWRRETELRRRRVLDGLTARDQELGLQ